MIRHSCDPEFVPVSCGSANSEATAIAAAGFGALAGKVIQICIRGDIVCDTTHIASLGLGSDIHYSGYGGFYAKDGPAVVTKENWADDSGREASPKAVTYAQDLCYLKDSDGKYAQCARADLSDLESLWEVMTLMYYQTAKASVWDMQGAAPLRASIRGLLP